MGLRERKKQQTEERIYRTALRLFQQRGYATTTVEEIAQAAEVAKGTFFNYFPTKDAVLGYLGQRQMRLVQQALAHTPEFEEQSTYEQLMFVLNTLAAGVQDDWEVMRAVSLETFRSASAFSDTTSAARQLYDLFLRIIRRGQERGELRTTAPAESLTLIVLSTYLYTFLAWLELDPPPPLTLLLQTHLNVLLEGMKPAPGTSL